MTAIVESMLATPPVVRALPTSPTRRIVPEDEAAISARDDEINVHIAKLLQEHG
ncbi:hypothetical protein ACF08M_12815 [Streptomyces sp. NPDC015032]|uniref:hypothetical protein n=1 Tax=Streptomyces sp. NPDC015032 TaxID=3364937 RepID=UPI0036F78585